MITCPRKYMLVACRTYRCTIHASMNTTILVIKASLLTGLARLSELLISLSMSSSLISGFTILTAHTGTHSTWASAVTNLRHTHRQHLCNHFQLCAHSDSCHSPLGLSFFFSSTFGDCFLTTFSSSLMLDET